MAGFFWDAAAIIPSMIMERTGHTSNEFHDRYKNLIKQFPQIGRITPYYDFMKRPFTSNNLYKFSEFKGGNMKKIASIVGVDVKDDDELLKLAIAGLAKAGVDPEVVVDFVAELDVETGLNKVAGELEAALDTPIDEDQLAILIADSMSNGKIEKRASENNLPAEKLAKKVLEKMLEPGEISKIAMKVFSAYGQYDGEKPLVKVASKLGVTDEEVKIAQTAVELISEGYSPEILKVAAEELYETTPGKLASAIVKGEELAAKHIAEGKVTTASFTKIAQAEDIPETFKIGYINAIQKLAFDLHPTSLESIAKKAGLKDATSYDVHNLIKGASILLGSDEAAPQAIYAYYDKKYALDKFAAETVSDFSKDAEEALVFLTKVASKADKIDFEETKAFLKTAAEALGMSVNEVGRQLLKTSMFLEGERPDVIRELEKNAGDILADVIKEETHEKIAAILEH